MMVINLMPICPKGIIWFLRDKENAVFRNAAFFLGFQSTSVLVLLCSNVIAFGRKSVSRTFLEIRRLLDTFLFR